VPNHLAIVAIGNAGHKCEQVVEGRVKPVRAQWFKAHDRFLWIVEEPTREAVQKIEIRANGTGEPASRVDQPRIKIAARDRAVHEGEDRDHIERKRDRCFDAKCGLPGNQVTHGERSFWTERAGSSHHDIALVRFR
jgi:hypothetical protein